MMSIEHESPKYIQHLLFFVAAREFIWVRFLLTMTQLNSWLEIDMIAL